MNEPLEVAGPKTTLRLVKMESALRIIISLCAFSLNENKDTRSRIITAIREQAKEALQ
jgi:hypothetical protein